MLLDVGMATGLTLTQAIGAYLRYLPFEAKLLPEERERLWKYILLWMPITCTIYLFYFLHEGLNVTTYKNVLVTAAFEVSMEKPKEKNGLPIFNNKCSLKIFAGEQTAVKSELVEAMLVINDNN